MSLLFPVAMVVIVVGFALVVVGSLGAGNSGGCFVWPFPFIVGCGFGSVAGATGVLSVVAFIALLAFAVFLFWRFRRPRAE